MDIYVLRVDVRKNFREEEYIYEETLTKRTGYEEKPKTYVGKHTRISKDIIGKVYKQYGDYEVTFLNIEDLQQYREEIHAKYRESLEREYKVINDKINAVLYKHKLGEGLEVRER